jgi:putative ABC transport system ATP-binding protein/lipoprotein-releasing system ATP-binding protein
LSLIQVQNLSKSYFLGEKKLEVLKGISLELPEKSFVTLMGPSGSGKSTLLHILAGLDRADSGSILFSGKEVTTYSDNEITLYRRNKIGVIFQFFNLIPYLDSLENVCLPLYLSGYNKKSAKEKASAVLESVGLKERIFHKPRELSGGEQQRVAIARSIVTDPELLLADEPTGNLDTENSDKIIELFMKLQKEKNIAVLMITHSPEIGKLGQKRLKMQDGKLVE